MGRLIPAIRRGYTLKSPKRASMARRSSSTSAPGTLSFQGSRGGHEGHQGPAMIRLPSDTIPPRSRVSERRRSIPEKDGAPGGTTPGAPDPVRGRTAPDPFPDHLTNNMSR